MSDIYLAVSTDEQEGYSVICAYSKKEDAETFIGECKKYEGTKEPYPEDDSDEFFNPWLKRRIDWIEAHPAGTQGDSDGFDVFTVELISKVA